MGGYVLDVSTDEMSPLPTEIPLRCREYKEMAQMFPQLLPTMLEEEIDDKSNADGAEKLIACLQALWFVVQCISRVAVSLPISLLEVCSLPGFPGHQMTKVLRS